MSSERLNELALQWQNAKMSEETAKSDRIAVENQIAGLVASKEEGTDSVQTNHFKITVTSKINRKLDQDSYEQVIDSIPEHLRPVDFKPQINLKKLRTLEAVDPTLPAKFVTTTPGKPTVKITEKEVA